MIQRLLGLTLLMLCLTSCAPADVASPEQVKGLLKEGALLVDVRSESEYRSGHLQGAVLVPHTQVQEMLAEFGDDKDRPIVVYCRSGGRSGLAKDVLVKNGFTSVYNGGGYQSLKSSGLK